MGRVEIDVSHSAITRALATLGGRAGSAEVAEALGCQWEPFEAQMRRRMRTRGREKRGAYLCLAKAGSEKVRFHLEVTGVISRREGRPRRPTGIVVKVGNRARLPRRRERMARRRTSGQCGGGQ